MVSEPTISLRDVKERRTGRVTCAERDALVEAAEAVGRLLLCPICQQWTRYADGGLWEPHKDDCPMARFSFDTEEGT